MKKILKQFVVWGMIATPLFVQAVTLGPTRGAESAPSESRTPLVLEGFDQSCAANLSKQPTKKYRPLGYVTPGLLDKFTRTNPILFNELYFRALGMALNDEGYVRIANTKGMFLEQPGEQEKKRILDMAEGDADQTIQIQGRIATQILNAMSEAFHLDEPVLQEERAALEAKKAGFLSTDAYLGTRETLLANPDAKAEIVELIRMSLPFGIKLGLDGVTKSNTKAIFVTSLATTAIGVGTYVASKLAMMLGLPDPGQMPLLMALGTIPFTGITTYLYTAPRKNLNKIHLWMMNRHNRKILGKLGYISKEDGVSNGLIRGAFKDLGELQMQVEVKDIMAVVPAVPKSTETSEVESVFFRFGAKLSEQLATVSAFQEEVATQWKLRTKSLGEPIFALGRMIELRKDQQTTRFEVPPNARAVLSDYSEEMQSIYDKLVEIENEYNALLSQFETHSKIGESWLVSNSESLDTRAKGLIEEKLRTLRNGLETVRALQNTVNMQKSHLLEEQTSVTSLLQAVSTVDASRALTDAEASRLGTSINAVVKKIKSSELETGKEGQ